MATEGSALMREAAQQQPLAPSTAGALLAQCCPCWRRGSAGAGAAPAAPAGAAPRAAADAGGAYNALGRESSAIPEAVWKGLWSEGEGAAKQ